MQPTNLHSQLFSCSLFLALSWIYYCDAQYVIGEKYGIGQNTPKSVFAKVSSARIFTEANAGNINSQYYAGLMSLYGAESVEQNEDNAKMWFRKSAELGNVEAQIALGILLSSTPDQQNNAAAILWLKKASEAGHSDAQWMLGRMYYDGKANQIKEPSMIKARYWFSKSAESDNPRGLFNFGVCYEYGLGGLDVDFSRAAELYEKASNAGDQESTYYLALMYLQGRGVRKSTRQSVLLLKKCAEGNFVPCLKTLAKIHISGNGLAIDFALAVAWLNKAIDLDTSGEDVETVQLRDELTKLILDVEERNKEVLMPFFEQNLPFHMAPSF